MRMTKIHEDARPNLLVLKRVSKPAQLNTLFNIYTVHTINKFISYNTKPGNKLMTAGHTNYIILRGKKASQLDRALWLL